MLAAAQISNHVYAGTVADALRRAVGHFRKPALIVNERTGRSVGAVKKWLARENGPGGAELVELMRDYDEVFEAICYLANRTPPAHITEEQREAAAQALRILTERR